MACVCVTDIFQISFFKCGTREMWRLWKGGRGNEDERKEERECGGEREEKKEDGNDQGRVDNEKGWRKKEEKKDSVSHKLFISLRTSWPNFKTI